MSARRLPTEIDAADALLAQALASGHYLKTPADEQCPAGLWMLVPLDRRLVQILELAGAERADLEGDEREADVDDEPSLGSLDLCQDQETWSDGVSARREADEEESFVDHRTAFTHPKLGRSQRL